MTSKDPAGRDTAARNREGAKRAPHTVQPTPHDTTPNLDTTRPANGDVDVRHTDRDSAHADLVYVRSDGDNGTIGEGCPCDEAGMPADTAVQGGAGGQARQAPEGERGPVRWEETVRAAAELTSALDVAGLRMSRLAPDADSPTARVELGSMDGTSAFQLAKLVRDGMRGTYLAEEKLRTALESHHFSFPELAVRHGRVHLGDVTPRAADALARLLGAPRPGIGRGSGGALSVREVAARLNEAVKDAAGVFLDVLSHPDCLRCDADAAVELGSLRPEDASRLATALQNTAA